MTVQHRSNAFLDTSTDKAAGQWDNLLSLQVELFLPQELDHLRADPAWQAARSVLDVGCGNGYYIARLHAFFPEKLFVGIDVSNELVALAQDQHAKPGLQFERGDFFAETEKGKEFDVVILRFVLQHLNDFSAILTSSARRLRPGGRLVIIEPSLAECETAPATPLFIGLMQAFERRQAELGRLRADTARIGSLAGQFPQWSVAREAVLSVPRVGPFAGSKTIAAFGHWIDLCERAAGFDYPFAATRAEVAEWGRTPAAFSRIALRVVELTFAGPQQ